MRKKVFGRKLSRGRGARHALFRSQIKALVVHGAITTTKAKAKAIQGDIDKLVNLAKQDSVAARRRLYAYLANDRKIASAFFDKISPAFTARRGGYTRIVNLPPRRGDAAQMARLEWVKEIVTSDKRQVTSKKSRIKLPGRKTTKKETSIKKE